MNYMEIDKWPILRLDNLVIMKIFGWMMFCVTAMKILLEIVLTLLMETMTAIQDMNVLLYFAKVEDHLILVKNQLLFQLMVN